MIRLYTDGSCRDTDDGPVVGWAWAAIDDELPEHTQCFQMGRGVITRNDWLVSRNVSGEIYAVIDGLNHLDESGVKKVTIFHDYVGIEKWVTAEWATKIPMTYEYADFVHNLRLDGMSISFHHVKAHSGDHWNEYVDRMAKEAVGL